MIIDARSIAEGSQVEADICVLGAGAAGITLAREFAGSRKRVCLVESGGLNLDIDTQALYQGEVKGWPYWPLDTCRIRFFGGTTNHWGGACLPLNEDDFRHKPWIPSSGWPISKSALLPFYHRAQPIFGLGDFIYDAPPLLPSDAKQLWTGGVVTTGMLQRSGGTRFGLKYRDEIEQADSVELYLYGNAVNLEANEARTRVEGVDVACLSGRRFRVRAHTYVLAMGGIENARLLLESHSGNDAGLGNEHDLVGRYFSDHLYLSNLGILQIMDPKVDFDTFLDGLTKNGTEMRFHLHFTPELQEREQLVNSRLHMKPVAWEKFYVDRGKPRPDLGDRIATKLHSLLRDLRGADGPEPKPAKAEDVGAPPGTRLFRFGAWTDVIPRAESRVYLGDERDALGMRKPVLDWKIGQEEKRSLMKSLRLFGEHVGRKGIGRMRVDLDEESPWPWKGGYEPGLHHMGTTRMSNSPQQGVVDADCKVHGLTNLYVAGSSVFPTYGTANPTLTIVALALRLADHLRQSDQQQ